MSTLDRKRLAAWLALTATAFATPITAAERDTPLAPSLGTPVTAEDLAKWDVTIFPDGRGLPKGSGTAAEGRALFATRCAHCHGEDGRGATAEELVGPLQPPPPESGSKAIGPYWPYATTLFDFIRRSMPADAPGSLSADEVYALTAYLLTANGLISADAAMNATSLPAVKMPARDRFDWIDAPK